MTNRLAKIVVFFARLGPYHHARLEAAAQLADLTAIEYSNVDRTYAWKLVTTSPPFSQLVLFKDRAYQDQTPKIKQQAIEKCLKQAQPDAVVVAGWSNPLSLMALAWCVKHGIPAILMSESTAYDESRKFWKELVKRRIVRLASTALVGGAPHQDYLTQLGFNGDRIFLGYDAVDNTYFTQGAVNARQHIQELRIKLHLPDKFFLASARFVKKKNLTHLIQAYAQYQAQAEVPPWHLVLLGDGDLRPQILAQVKQLGIEPWVHLLGFKQYDELPNYYGLAHCFIHASTTEQWGLVVNEAMASGLPVLVSNRCGCAPDLVQEGHNGYTFDPYNPNQLTDLMLKIASGACDLTAMGQASQEIIAHWSPQTFADNLQKAVELALTLPCPKVNPLDRALLWALSRR